MNRKKANVFDHIVVTRNGDVAGIVSVQDILNKMLNVQKTECTFNAFDQ